MLAASVTLLVASDHEHRAFLPPSEAARRCTGGVVTVARLSSFLARRPHDSSPRGVAHLLRAHRHPLHRPRRPHAALQRAPRGPSTPGHTAGRRPHQRDPRRSPYNARPSARSSRSVNPRRGRGSRGTPRTLGAPDKCAAHPHGSPQMSHAIPQHIIQTLNSDRCNSNVFSAYRKLTKGNYVRLFWEERLPQADEAGAGQADTRIVVAREPLATTPSHGSSREPHPLHSRERPARRQRSYKRSGEPCRPLTGRPWMSPCRRTRPHHETRARRRCRP